MSAEVTSRRKGETKRVEKRRNRNAAARRKGGRDLRVIWEREEDLRGGDTIWTGLRIAHPF